MKPPEYKDRDHPGDTVSHLVQIFGKKCGEKETGRFHFPTGDWCHRDSTWDVVSWRDLS